MKKGLIYVAGWAALAVTGLIALPMAKAGIETRLKSEAEAKLAQAGITDVAVSVSGQDVALNGSEANVIAASEVLKTGLTGGVFSKPGDGFWTGPVTTINGPPKQIISSISFDSAETSVSESVAASESVSASSQVNSVSVSSSSAATSSAVATVAAAEPAKPLNRAGRRCQDRITAIIARKGVQYKFNAYELTPEGKRTMREVYRVLSRCPAQVKLTITGHTDNVGSEAVNTSLSAGRAVEAMNALTAQGWPDARVKAVGAGSSEPIASNATFAGRKKNRRIVFALSPAS